MGDFRIVIDAVGGHGVDRNKKSGETVDFNIEGQNSPEAIAKRLIEELQSKGCSIQEAKIIHWPLDNYGGQLKNNRSTQIVDCFLTGKRTGSF